MKEQGFKLGGIDLLVSEQLKEKSLNSIRREQTITDNTLKHVKENDGGVVVVLGFGHCIFQQMIKEQDENANQYLWYHVHNPDNETQAYKELVESYTKKDSQLISHWELIFLKAQIKNWIPIFGIR